MAANKTIRIPVSLSPQENLTLIDLKQCLERKENKRLSVAEVVRRGLALLAAQNNIAT